MYVCCYSNIFVERNIGFISCTSIVTLVLNSNIKCRSMSCLMTTIKLNIFGVVAEWTLYNNNLVAQQLNLHTKYSICISQLGYYLYIFLGT